MLTVISGPMFSGKTEELLRIYSRYLIAKKECNLYKPVEDSRHEVSMLFAENHVCSRSGAKYPANDFINSIDPKEMHSASHIFIDEAWMISIPNLTMLVKTAISNQVLLFVTVLNVFAHGGDIPQTNFLLSQADKIKFLTNICSFCGTEGSKTLKCGGTDSSFEVGEHIYQAVCTTCWSARRD